MTNNEKSKNICSSVFKSGESTTSKLNSHKNGLSLSVKLKKIREQPRYGDNDKPLFYDIIINEEACSCL